MVRRFTDHINSVLINLITDSESIRVPSHFPACILQYYETTANIRKSHATLILEYVIGRNEKDGECAFYQNTLRSEIVSKSKLVCCKGKVNFLVLLKFYDRVMASFSFMFV